MPQGVKKWEWGYEDTGEISEGPSRSYSEVWYATMYSKLDSIAYVFLHRKCPKYGDPHDVDKSAFVSRVKPTRVGETNVIKVTVDYETNITAPDNNPDPLKRPAVITWDTRIEVVPTLFEANGKLRINPVGDLVPGKKKKPFRTYTIRKNVTQIPDWFSTLPGSTNQHAFYFDGQPRPERTLQMLETQKPERVLENGVWYYPLSYQIEEDPETYDIFEPATSFHELEKKVVPVGFNFNNVGGQVVHKKTQTIYTKKRILVGDPKEYAKDKQFVDKDGRAIILQEDTKNGGIDVSKIYVQRRRDLTEVDFSVIQPTIT